MIPFLLTLLLGKPNPNGKKREGKSGPFFTFSEADLFGILEKGRELLSPKEAVEMKEAGSYRF